MSPKVEFIGKPNLQRFAETWFALVAARKGMAVVPGSVRVELKEGKRCSTGIDTTASAESA